MASRGGLAKCPRLTMRGGGPGVKISENLTTWSMDDPKVDRNAFRGLLPLAYCFLLCCLLALLPFNTASFSLPLSTVAFYFSNSAGQNVSHFGHSNSVVPTGARAERTVLEPEKMKPFNN